MSISIESPRVEAANKANRADAEVWRWFCCMYEENRLSWLFSSGKWSVRVDDRPVASDFDFDSAVRAARARSSSRGRPIRPQKSPKPSEILVTVGVGRVKMA